MALKEHKPGQLTPHAKKVKKYLAVKSHARELLPSMLAAAYPGLREQLAVTQATKNEEQARAIKDYNYDLICRNCFQLAEKFEETSRKLRGKFLAED